MPRELKPRTLAGIVILLAVVAVAVLSLRHFPTADIRSDKRPDRTRLEEAPEANEPKEARRSADGAHGDAPEPSEPRNRQSGPWTIEGVVLLDGVPSAAAVELRVLRPFDASYPAAWQERWLVPATEPAPGATAWRTVRSAPDGRFRFDDLPAAEYEVSARDDWDRIATDAVAAGLSSRGAFITLELATGPHTFRARARYGDDRPFDGFVNVVVEGDVQRKRVRPAADGRFACEGLPEGTLHLVAFIPGSMEARSPPLILPRTGEFDFDVDAGLDRITGSVVEDPGGAPVSGARVVASSAPDLHGRAVRTVRTDHQGRFEVAAAIHSSEFKVTADGHAPVTLESRALRLDRSSKPVIIRLQKTATLEGRVVDEKGAPARGVPVFGVSGSPEQPDSVSRSVSDDDGSFRLERIPPGSGLVVAFGAGWVSKSLETAVLEGYNPFLMEIGPGPTTVEPVVVRPGARVRGRVIGPEGRPVARAHVNAWPLPCGLEELLHTWTDADGQFEFESLPPTNLTFAAEAPGFAPGERQPHRVDRTGVVEVEVRLRPERWIDFTVVDAAGSPVPNAKVVVDSGRSERTDSKGRTRIGLGAWSYCYQVNSFVSATGYLSRAVSIPSIHNPDPPSSIRVVLPKAEFVSGRVRLPDGRPAANAYLFAEHCDPDRRVLPGISCGDDAADGDGRFRIATSGGRMRIEAHFATRDQSFSGSWEGEAGERGITVVLAPVAWQVEPPEPRHTIRVLDPEGQPVASGSCQADSILGENDRLPLFDAEIESGLVHPTSSSGPHAWILRISGARDRKGRLLAPHSSVQPGGSARDILIHLPLAEVIEGTVLDPEGRGVRSCGVVAKPLYGSRLARTRTGRDIVHGWVLTDPSGRFRFEGLAPMPYRLEASLIPPEFHSAVPQRVVAPASGVVIPLLRGVPVTLTFLDEEGKPLVRAHVTAWSGRKQDPMIEAWTDAEGRAILNGLEPARPYSLEARPEGRSDLIPLERKSWTPKTETFRLERSHVVSGTVSDGCGRPVSGAIVWARVGEDEWRHDWTGRDGAFSIDGLRAGMVRIRVSARSEEARDGAESEVLVPAGSSDVRLTLPAVQELSVRLENWPDAPSARGIALLGWDRPDGTWCVDEQELRGRAEAVFRGPRRDRRYWFFARIDGGLCAYLKRMPIGSEKIVVPLRPGKVIDGRVVVTGDHGEVRARVQARKGPIRIDEPVAKDGAFRIDGLLAGEWLVEVSVLVGEKVEKRTAAVLAGRPVTFEVSSKHE